MYSISSSSPWVKIQIMGRKVCLRCKGKTLIYEFFIIFAKQGLHGKANKYFTLASYSSGTFFSNKYKSKCNFDLLLVIVDFCWSQGFLIFSNLPFLVLKFPFSCKSTSICLKISTVLGIFELQKAPMIYVVYFYTC